MNELIFLKLGGSLITDKTGVEAVRAGVLSRLAGEIYQAQAKKPSLRLVLGHGSGSFGHVAAAKYGTRQGVDSPEQWHGFAMVSDAAARLDRLVMSALLAAGIPAVSLPPSASASCTDGRITSIATTPVQAALDAGLVPVIYGDVAFDAVRGGTIISTEEVMMALVDALRPSWLLLAGETAGVLGHQGQVVPEITATTFGQIKTALGASRGTDVTGGMAGKVKGMLDLVQACPYLAIRLFSGLAPDLLMQTVLDPQYASGTCIRHV